MTLLIIFATISIFFSFLCSILEAVLLSITPTFINLKKSEGATYAAQLEIFKKDVDKPLIAILTINTWNYGRSPKFNIQEDSCNSISASISAL